MAEDENESSVDLRNAEIISEIIDQWVESDEATRPSVEELVAAHPELAPGLRSCLDGLLRIRRGVDGLRCDSTTVGDAPNNPSDTQSTPEIPGFEILGELGRGGMGIVYRARQESLDRVVALKVLPTGSVDPRAAERFVREAELAATLHHTHIVPIHAVGHHNGLHWYAMQCIEGNSLVDWNTIKPARPGDAIDKAIEIGIGAANALQHAHDRGVIHRDVKPGNLLLDECGHLWLTDFGLARRSADVTATVTGAMIGTPRYMSVEQISVSDENVDHRTDIYSLGATLYELVTGKPLFDADSPLKLLAKIQNDDPTPPATISPAVSRELNLVLLKSLDKDRDRRYQTAQAFADDLRAVRDHLPISARGLPVWVRATRWYRRHETPVRSVAAAALATAVALLLLLGLLQQYRQTQRGHLRIATDGQLHLASVQPADDGADASFLMTTPNLQPIELKADEYAVRLDSQGRFSESARVDVLGGETTKVRYVDRRIEPKSIDLTERLAVPLDDGGLAVLGRNELEVFGAAATKRFSIECSKLLPVQADLESVAENGKGDKAKRPEAKNLAVSFAFDPESNFQGDHNVLRSPFARIPRVVRETIDLDGDGRKDLLVTAAQHAAIAAISHDGEPLWSVALQFPEDPAYVLSKYPLDGFPVSVIVDVIPVEDTNGDDVIDLLINAARFEDSGIAQHMLVLVSGKSSETLRRQALPVVDMTSHKAWPNSGLLRYRRQYSDDDRNTLNIFPRAGQDLRRSELHQVYGTTWGGGRTGTGLMTLSTPQLGMVNERLVAVTATERTLRVFDLHNDAPDSVVAVALPESLFDGPQRVELGEDQWGVIMLSRNASNGFDDPHLNLYVPGEDRLRWRIPYEAKLLNQIANAAKSDLPICADLDGDGIDEILLSMIDDSWNSFPKIQCLDALTGKSKWDIPATIIGVDQAVQNCQVVGDVDRDGVQDVAVASLAVPEPVTATGDIAALQVCIDVLSGRDGSRIGWRHTPLFNDATVANVVEIDSFVYDSQSAQLLTSVVVGGPRELELDSLTVVMDMRDEQRTSMARGLTFLDNRALNVGQSGSRYYRRRPGPFGLINDAAVWDGPMNSTLWLNSYQMGTTFDSITNGKQLLMISQGELARCVNLRDGVVNWQTPVECDGSAPVFVLPNADGSSDLLLQQSSVMETVSTIIDGETGKLRFAVNEEHIAGEFQYLWPSFAEPSRYFYALADAEFRNRSGRLVKGSSGFVLFKVDRQAKRVLWHRPCFEGLDASKPWMRPSDVYEADINGDKVPDIVVGDIDNEDIVVRGLDGKTGAVIWTAKLGLQAVENQWARNQSWPKITVANETDCMFVLGADPVGEMLDARCLNTRTGETLGRSLVSQDLKQLRYNTDHLALHIISQDGDQATIGLVTKLQGARNRMTVWTQLQWTNQDGRFRETYREEAAPSQDVAVVEFPEEAGQVQEGRVGAGTYRISYTSDSIECRSLDSPEILYQVEHPQVYNSRVIYASGQPLLKGTTKDSIAMWWDLRDGSLVHESKHRHATMMFAGDSYPTLIYDQRDSESDRMVVGLTNEGIYVHRLESQSVSMDSAPSVKLQSPDDDPRYHRSLNITGVFIDRRLYIHQLLISLFATGGILLPLAYVIRYVRRRQLSLRALLLAPPIALLALYSWRAMSNHTPQAESAVSNWIAGTMIALAVVSLVYLLRRCAWKALMVSVVASLAGGFAMVMMSWNTQFDKIPGVVYWIRPQDVLLISVGVLVFILPAIAAGHWKRLRVQARLAD
ncbi:serine/threonine protein kinase [Stieleria varia]|uniref:Serine/threonine-protein kinase PknB n=1 Tax=Stieleria varia TaxID=2528005 RepID=A0A5C6ASK5_9BACT|nr:serine/threonine-protein kinase [Stieleria varia]TWU02249.1 Serine/threonine-protein kinase PknB [Stieleria varia]